MYNFEFFKNQKTVHLSQLNITKKKFNKHKNLS